MTHYIQHTDGRSIEYKRYPIFSVKRHNKNIDFLSVVEHFESPELSEFVEKFKTLYTLLGLTPGEPAVVPMHLSKTLVPSSAEQTINADLSRFKCFIQTVAELNTLWTQIRPGFKKLSVSTSERYQEDCKDNNYYYVRDGELVDDRGTVPIVNVVNPRFLASLDNYHMCEPADLYRLGVYTNSDLADIAGAYNGLSRLMRQELYQTNSYELSQAQSLVLEPTTVSFIAVTVASRMPPQCWVKTVGSGGNTQVHLVDSIAEATAYHDPEVRTRTLGVLKSRNYQYAEVSFQATPQAVVNDSALALEIQAGLESNLLKKELPITKIAKTAKGHKL